MSKAKPKMGFYEYFNVMLSEVRDDCNSFYR